MQPTSQLACHLVAWFAAMVTVGAWTTSAFLRPRTGTDRLRLTGDRLLGVARGAGLV